MTAPQDLPAALQTLLQEVSASASTPITDNDGTTMTLREAIIRILWKENFLLPLANRPLPPTQTDDQYGHGLSARAEGLITQAVLVDLAARLGTDVAGIRTAVLKSLNGSTS